eukprot:5793504-Pyramimonas_sp.AAC.1
MAVLASELTIGSARSTRSPSSRSSNYAGALINACVSFPTCSTTSQCSFMSNFLLAQRHLLQTTHHDGTGPC